MLKILNKIFFYLQYAYMKPGMTRERVGLHEAHFHPRDTKKNIMENWRKSLQKLKTRKILVTGVFDVLHEEHIGFLRKAKKLGNYLIIAIESDKRVKKIKGPDRPINSQSTRAKNLKKLKLADEIVILPENFDWPVDHLKFLQKIKPNVLAVSSHTKFLDRKEDLMSQIGGKLVIVHEHNPQVSTTQILQKPT